MNVHGHLDFRCKPDRPAPPVAFASGESYLVSVSLLLVLLHRIT